MKTDKRKLKIIVLILHIIAILLAAIYFVFRGNIYAEVAGGFALFITGQCFIFNIILLIEDITGKELL